MAEPLTWVGQVESFTSLNSRAPESSHSGVGARENVAVLGALSLCYPHCPQVHFHMCGFNVGVVYL